MAGSRRSTNAAASGTWGINPTVRRALARGILDLRGAVEDDYRKQLVALGVRPSGTVAPGRALDPNEQRARNVALAVIGRDVQAGIKHADAVERFVRESAYTFLNRIVGLRCLDERGLLIVGGQAETAVKLDPARNASFALLACAQRVAALDEPARGLAPDAGASRRCNLRARSAAVGS